MVYFKGTQVYNPWTPRIMKKGGCVYPSPNISKRQLNNDSVLAILQPNGIVIPIKYKKINVAKRVENYLKRQNIYLPHFKK